MNLMTGSLLMVIERRLSELEGCVLGIVREKGPCTPYLIRKIFLDSPSPSWSNSAGTIYPLVERLEEHGLIKSEEQMTGRRRSKQYILTDEGQKALRNWLWPLEDWIVGVPPDPLRTRMIFIMALPSKKRAKFLTDARNRIQTHLQLIEEKCAQEYNDGERLTFLIDRGVIRMLQARLDWIDEVERELNKR